MSYENITLLRRNMTMVDGYFYMLEHSQDAMIVKTDDGTQAYSYPLDTVITNQVVSLEWDGRNFWSLENPTGDSVLIKMWNFENYILKQRKDFLIKDTGTHYFDANALAVEHYHIRFKSDASIGSSIISMYQPKTHAADMDLIDKLSGQTISLGPNSNGQVEDIVVNTVTVQAIGQETIYNVNLNSPTTYAYDGPTVSGSGDYRARYGDPASFNTRLWLFNNRSELSTSTGALYSMSPTTLMGGLDWIPGGEYQGVQSATFFDIPNYVFDRDWQSTPSNDAFNWPKFNSIAYVRTSNLIFLNPNDFSESYGSMTMDNVHQNQTSILPVYDLTMEGVNVYRLQEDATYYGTTYPWSSYNYQLSTLEPFITSISLRANPAILPANGVNVSVITAIVKDQFNLPIAGKLVYFTEDDPNGSISGSNPGNTDSDGVASTAYTAGTTAREVKITATAQQGGVETPTD